ncbi:MAG: Kazal-type serine protease inhibitor family protein [Candidatus Diapherotrites archaeon]|nr:Kazal-type serine protease inhibitor family protein [Candidatus Diapherotrites archaeon]
MLKLENKSILIVVVAVVILSLIVVVAVLMTEVSKKKPTDSGTTTKIDDKIVKPTPTSGGKTGGESKTPPTGCYCPQVYQPVCGSDGKTYGNSCEASCAGIKVAYEGACGTKNAEQEMDKELENMLEELEKEEGGLESEIPAPPQ